MLHNQRKHKPPVRITGSGFNRTRIKSRIRTLLLRRLSKLGFRFGVTGEAARKHFLRLGIDSQNLYRLPYVIDNDSILAEVGKFRRDRNELRRNLVNVSDPKTTVFLMITKLIKRESPLLGIQAFITSLSRSQDARLVIIGDGPDRSVIERLCLQSGNKNILLLGYQPYSELPKFYAICDWFVHIPPEEPWGLSVNEACASSLPLITSMGVGAAQDLLKNNVNGYFVGHDDIASIEDAFRRSMSLSSQQTSEMGSASLKLSNRVHFKTWIQTLHEFANGVHVSEF